MGTEWACFWFPVLPIYCVTWAVPFSEPGIGARNVCCALCVCTCMHAALDLFNLLFKCALCWPLFCRRDMNTCGWRSTVQGHSERPVSLVPEVCLPGRGGLPVYLWCLSMMLTARPRFTPACVSSGMDALTLGLCFC